MPLVSLGEILVKLSFQILLLVHSLSCPPLTSYIPISHMIELLLMFMTLKGFPSGSVVESCNTGDARHMG